MTKAEVRRQFPAQRKALTAGEVKRRSQLIAWHFFDFLEKHSLANEPAIVHTFLPIHRQNEVDTWPIIRCLWAKFGHLLVAVPVTNSKENTMRHYLLFPKTALFENRWGIPEPVVSGQQHQPANKFNLVLVPLLAFDLQGHRVGYGGGYYDRFLADCRPDCLKVGLSLFEPIQQIEDIESTDISLTDCITPTQIFNFK